MPVTKTEKRTLLEHHSPAARLAAERGEETKIIVIAPSYEEERFRSISVNDNPSCKLPVDTEVEVGLDEYEELMRVAELRKRNKRETDDLEREFKNRKKYL